MVRFFKYYDFPDYDIHVLERYIVRMMFSFWAVNMITIAKVFYGLVWFCKPSRHKFVKYYRVAMT